MIQFFKEQNIYSVLISADLYSSVFCTSKHWSVQEAGGCDDRKAISAMGAIAKVAEKYSVSC